MADHQVGPQHADRVEPLNGRLAVATHHLVEFDDGLKPKLEREPGWRKFAEAKVQFEAAVNQPTIWNAVCDLSLLSRMFPRSRVFARRKMGWWDHQDDRDVPGLAGSAILVRRAALDRVGLLDETMFYVEDMDLCRRARALGATVAVANDVQVLHVRGVSSRSRPLFVEWHKHRGFWRYFRKFEEPSRSRLQRLAVFGLIWGRFPIATVRALARTVTG